MRETGNFTGAREIETLAGGVERGQPSCGWFAHRERLADAENRRQPSGEAHHDLGGLLMMFDRSTHGGAAIARPLLSILLVLTSLACSRAPEPLSAQTDPRDANAAAETISAADLRVRIGALAHDSMRGRPTPSPELEKAARHIARRFESFGLLPGDGDSYLQTFPLTFSSRGASDGESLTIDGPGGGAIGSEDFIAVPSVSGRATGELRVVDLGAPGVLTGTIALVSVSQSNANAALTSARDLLDAGASGVLFAVDASDQYFEGLRRFFSRERMAVGVPDELIAPTALVRMSSLPAALQSAIGSGGPAGQFSANLRTSASFRQDQALNTIGWIEGSDPELRDEYIVFTAHMDHVGVGRPVDGDSIYNGADDDASGTATIIELAEAFASLPTPPRRSLVFMTVSGEENGLLGSAWYAEHPLFPTEETVANINIDMIGRNWEDTVVAIGRDESTLGDILERVLEEHAELGLAMIDDPWPEENFYFRSDHFNFARKGVPILFFFTGPHEDYHGPNDEADRILYDKTARIGRLIFFLGIEIANEADRPQWDAAAYRRIVEGAGS